MKSSYNAVYLGAGMEKRRGTTRIQGVYGAQAGISLGGSSMTNDFDEALSATNPGDPMMPRVTEADLDLFPIFQEKHHFYLFSLKLQSDLNTDGV